MQFGRFLLVLPFLFTVSCCKLGHRVGSSDGANIPVPEEGSELKDVNFAFDSSALDEGAKSTLRANAEWLKANANVKVQVEGHCDERGTNEYNMALGNRRAASAVSYLKSLGIDAKRLSTISYGEELPLDPAHSEAAWAKNRRAHTTIQR